MQKPDKNTDSILIQRFRDGETGASKDLYARFSGKVCAICRRYLSDEEDVKDAMQETFIRVFRHIDRFEYRQEGGLWAWIARIAGNECMSMLRREAMMPTSPLEEDVEVSEEDLDELQQIPPEDVLAMVRKLPEGYRNVLNLYVFEEKSHKEIAAMLGISPMTSASQYCRAKRLLLKMIHEAQNRRSPAEGKGNGNKPAEGKGNGNKPAEGKGKSI
ncbi:MAG: sigma-70 family RNA polymerase sigma factor [Bacteroidales bacterium]|nr:sigma-70 family RNA polymerase sigma factor [Bacteroidales bacterium]